MFKTLHRTTIAFPQPLSRSPSLTIGLARKPLEYRKNTSDLGKAASIRPARLAAKPTTAQAKTMTPLEKSRETFRNRADDWRKNILFHFDAWSPEQTRQFLTTVEGIQAKVVKILLSRKSFGLFGELADTVQASRQNFPAVLKEIERKVLAFSENPFEFLLDYHDNCVSDLYKASLSLGDHRQKFVDEDLTLIEASTFEVVLQDFVPMSIVDAAERTRILRDVLLLHVPKILKKLATYGILPNHIDAKRRKNNSLELALLQTPDLSRRLSDEQRTLFHASLPPSLRPVFLFLSKPRTSEEIQAFREKHGIQEATFDMYARQVFRNLQAMLENQNQYLRLHPPQNPEAKKTSKRVLLKPKTLDPSPSNFSNMSPFLSPPRSRREIQAFMEKHGIRVNGFQAPKIPSEKKRKSRKTPIPLPILEPAPADETPQSQRQLKAKPTYPLNAPATPILKPEPTPEKTPPRQASRIHELADIASRIPPELVLRFEGTLEPHEREAFQFLSRTNPESANSPEASFEPDDWREIQKTLVKNIKLFEEDPVQYLQKYQEYRQRIQKRETKTRGQPHELHSTPPPRRVLSMTLDESDQDVRPLQSLELDEKYLQRSHERTPHSLAAEKMLPEEPSDIALHNNIRDIVDSNWGAEENEDSRLTPTLSEPEQDGSQRLEEFLTALRPYEIVKNHSEDITNPVLSLQDLTKLHEILFIAEYSPFAELRKRARLWLLQSLNVSELSSWTTPGLPQDDEIITERDLFLLRFEELKKQAAGD